MGKVYFIFGCHNHQPVGNFHHVFEEAYRKCYYPFIKILEQYPKIKMSIHNSGPLYDWLKENQPEYIKILRGLVDRGQVEIISGGYYEPILPLISEIDKKGQINQMNQYIKKEFRQKSKGMWLAERVWEPYLARIMNQCGVEYTFLDDTHFRYAGLSENDFTGYYTTEDEGKGVFVFPINKKLRYKIPFSQTHESISAVESFAKYGDVIVTLFDDGEKFGLWPNTYEWIYEKQWLKNFFNALGQSNIIETITPAQAIEKFSSNGLAYLPAASYEEMGEWVLESDVCHAYENLKTMLKQQGKFEEYSSFVRGGFFRNFYRKYPRLNYMHKKMMMISRQVHAIGAFSKDKEITQSLWKAQTNCGYWHGVFGGFYLGHIRAAVFSNLIKTVNLMDKKKKTNCIEVIQEDIDLDGNPELEIRNKKMIACFSFAGAVLIEWSLREKAINLVNTITRQPESYHAKIRQSIDKQSLQNQGVATIHDNVVLKDNDLDKYLIYDPYQRVCLVDLLLDKNIDSEMFNCRQGVESLSPRIYEGHLKQNKNKVEIQCRYQQSNLDFIKKIEIGQDAGLIVSYAFTNTDILDSCDFAVEFNLALPSLNDIFIKDKNRDVPLKGFQTYQNMRSLIVRDTFLKLNIEFIFDTAEVMIMPVYSVSSSESGFEKGYQQIALIFISKEKTDRFKMAVKAKD